MCQRSQKKIDFLRFKPRESTTSSTTPQSKSVFKKKRQKKKEGLHCILLFGNIDTSRSEQKTRQLRIRTRERKLKAFLCGEVCIESVSSPPRATTQARTSIHTFHQWPSQSCQTVLSTIHQWLRPKCKATGSRGRHIKAQPGSSDASTNMVRIIRFQSIIIACQTSLTGFSNTPVVLFCFVFVQFPTVLKQDAELSCRHTLGWRPSWHRQLTLKAATPNTFLWIGTLKMQWHDPGRWKMGKGQNKSRRSTLSDCSDKQNKYKSSRVPLTQEGQKRWSVSS